MTDSIERDTARSALSSFTPPPTSMKRTWHAAPVELHHIADVTDDRSIKHDVARSALSNFTATT